LFSAFSSLLLVPLLSLLFLFAMPFNPDKLAALVGKQTAVVRTGGKGSVRRKHKAVRKTATLDDKKLKATLNKLAVRDIPAIEEVNLFKDDGHVIHFVQPKVQASIQANTYAVSGQAETKKLQDLLPGIITQLGPDNLNDLKKIYASFAAGDKAAQLKAAAAAAAAGGAGAAGGEDEDDVPDLVENFEEVSKGGDKKDAAAAADKPADK